jgi:hypothetical protein
MGVSRQLRAWDRPQIAPQLGSEFRHHEEHLPLLAIDKDARGDLHVLGGMDSGEVRFRQRLPVEAGLAGHRVI